MRPTFGRTFDSRLPDHLITFALLLCVFTGCAQLQKLAKPTVLKSPDGKFQLTVPIGWRENASLNEQAEIKAANKIEEAYVIVITETKSDFAKQISLDEFTSISRESLLATIESPDATEPRSVTVNGNSARAYEIQGAVNNIKIAYLVTTVDTTDHYHQILTWTLQSRKDKNQKMRQEVIDSFRPTSQKQTDATAK
jgi:bifunctional DNA-binding transcriptional regulator/antitoxin component of YhaV-PrlF toxin-antitoxin module